MRAVADGGSPAIEKDQFSMPTLDQDLTVVTPPDDRSVGVLAFTGHNVVSVDLASAQVRTLSAGRRPVGAAVAAVPHGARRRDRPLAGQPRPVLVAPATGRPNGMELAELTEFVAIRCRRA